MAHHATFTLSPQHQLYSVKYLYRCICKYVCISILFSVPMNCIYMSVLLPLNIQYKVIQLPTWISSVSRHLVFRGETVSLRRHPPPFICKVDCIQVSLSYLIFPPCCCDEQCLRLFYFLCNSLQRSVFLGGGGFFFFFFFSHF